MWSRAQVVRVTSGEDKRTIVCHNFLGTCVFSERDALRKALAPFIERRRIGKEAGGGYKKAGGWTEVAWSCFLLL
jgi:hypothetical protein